MRLAVKFLPQLWVDQVVDLLSTLQLESTISPSCSEFFESWAFTVLLILDGLHIEVEVSAEKMRPELIKKLHVGANIAGGRMFAFLQCPSMKGSV